MYNVYIFFLSLIKLFFMYFYFNIPYLFIADDAILKLHLHTRVLEDLGYLSFSTFRRRQNLLHLYMFG